MRRFPKVQRIAIIIVVLILLAEGITVYLILGDAFWFFFLTLLGLLLLVPYFAVFGLAEAGLPIPFFRLLSHLRKDESCSHGKPSTAQDDAIKPKKKSFVTLLRTVGGILFGLSMISPLLFERLLKMPLEWRIPSYVILFSLTIAVCFMMWIVERRDSQ